MLEFLIEELSIEEISNLTTTDRGNKDKIIAAMITLCKDGTLEFYGDINGWKTIEGVNPYPKVKGYSFGTVPLNGDAGEFHYNAKHCLIRRDDLKRYLVSVNQYPNKDSALANWLGNNSSCDLTTSKELKPVTAKPTKKPINEQRDDDFTQWINESKPDLEQLTKKQVQQELIKRNRQLSNSQLWCSGFDDWIKHTTLYKGKAGRPKTA